MPPKPKDQDDDSQLVCINIPETKVDREPHTIAELASAAKNSRASRIANEFDRGLKFVKKYPKSVTVYGSARFKESNVHYKDARKLAFEISRRGYTVITGGGPGIMEAANRGAKEAGGQSVGLNIKLPHEQIINPYVTDSMNFFYFFSRKTTMSFSAEAYIFYPGGYGTLDELFEILTLVQTHKIHRIPIILVGSDFWKPLAAFLTEQCYKIHAATARKDLDLFLITDDHKEILDIVTAAPQQRFLNSSRIFSSIDGKGNP